MINHPAILTAAEEPTAFLFLIMDYFSCQERVIGIAGDRSSVRTFTYSMLTKGKGRGISPPASCCSCLPGLFEPGHDLVNNAEEDFVVIFIFDKCAKCLGMRVERREVTSPIFVDQLSPVTSAAGP